MLAKQREAYEQRMSEPVSAGDTVLFSGFMLAVLALGIGGLVAPVWAVRRWQGGWRIAAAVPLAIMAFVVIRIVIDTARDAWERAALAANGGRGGAPPRKLAYSVGADRGTRHPPPRLCHLVVNAILAVTATCTGTPFRVAGMNSHCAMAVLADRSRLGSS